jgi:hypothetical protein
MRRLTLLAVLVAGGIGGITSAEAASPRQAATDQYTTAPVVGSGTVDTTATTPTAPTEPVESAGSGGTDPGSPSGSGNGNTGGSGNGGGTSPADDQGGTAGSAAASSAGSAAESVITVAVLDFGRAPKKLRDDIQAAIDQAGLQSTKVGITEKRFQAFLASPLLKLLSPDGVKAAGRAFGAQLINPTATLRQAFPVLFGAPLPTDPIKQVVLTRRIKIPAREAATLAGVAAGLKTTDVPLAYVERSDVKKSFVAAYKKREILTVGDVDTVAGKLRLTKILLGQITTQKAVDAVEVNPASAVIGNSDAGTGTTPWLLLVALVGGGAVMATGTVRRRRRSGSTA